MTVSATSNINVSVTAQSGGPLQAAILIAAPDEGAPVAVPPGDTVTLSDSAQQALANPGAGTPPGDDTSQDPAVAAFYSQAAIVMDTSGTYSQDDQLKAYVGLWNTMEAGFPAGLGSDAGKVFDDAMINSPIGQLQHQLSDSFNNAGVAAFQMGNSNNAPAVAKAELGVVNGWSDFEKNVFFQTNVDEKLKIGGNHFGSVENWISSLQDIASSGGESAAPAQAAGPIGLTDAQKNMVATVIGAGSAGASASPSTATLSAPAIDSKTALAQGIAKLLSDGQQAQPTFAELVAQMESADPAATFIASPKSGSVSGEQLNQSA